MDIVVTGGAGFIGTSLCLSLIREGHKVTIVDNYPRDYLSESLLKTEFTYFQSDLSRISDVIDRGKKYDALVHLAFTMSDKAESDLVTASHTNTYGSACVLDLVTRLQIPVAVVASSIAVFGSSQEYKYWTGPLDESLPRLGAQGVKAYAAGKIYLEFLSEMAADRGATVVGIRPGIIIGPGRVRGKTSAINRLLDDAIRLHSISIPDSLKDAAFPAIYVEDVVRALHALVVDRKIMPGNSGCVYYNLGGDSVTFSDIVGHIAEIVDIDISIDKSTNNGWTDCIGNSWLGFIGRLSSDRFYSDYEVSRIGIKEGIHRTLHSMGMNEFICKKCSGTVESLVNGKC